MELDTVAAGLYALPRDEFTPARTEQVRLARSAGDKPLAAAIGRLRRPTVAAWLLNQFARRRPADLAPLAELGAQLRAAHEQLDGAALRELSARRRALLAELATTARQVADECGTALSEAVGRELESVFTAALAHPEAARALAGGRLSSAKDLVDLDDPATTDWPATAPDARPRPVTTPPVSAPVTAPTVADPTVAVPTVADAAPAPALLRARAELTRTETALSEAEARCASTRDAYDSAVAEETAAHQQVARRRAQLIDAEQAEQGARQRARFARRRREDGDRELRDARRRVTVAQDRLTALEQ